MKRLLRYAVCLLPAGLLLAFGPEPELLRRGLALFALIAALWMTQALPLSVTALIVPLLATLAGLADLRSALLPFADPIIFVFLGGFVLAAALSRHGLDRLLAGAVLRLARGQRLPAVLMLAALTATLSMWMNNTATIAIMLPLAIGLFAEREAAAATPSRETAFVLLALAYSASIGGAATLVGSAPNGIAAAQAGIGFAEWLAIGAPIVALLWPAMLLTLYLLLRPQLRGAVQLEASPVFVWTRGSRMTVLIFAFTVAAWVFGRPLGRVLGISAGWDATVALAALLAMVASRALDWKDIENRTPWGVLILFGGGLSLGELVGDSGASRYLAEALLGMTEAMPAWLLLSCLLAFVVFMTELVSNTATTALLLPIFLPVAVALQLPPPVMAAAIAIAASCAFMLPVATPPNAMVFATERVAQATMMRCGFVLNLVSVLLILLICLWHWP